MSLATEAVRLSRSSLDLIRGNVNVPAYIKQGLKAGIIHFGVGNFHRAHQSRYLHKLFEIGHDHDWALVGAGLRQEDLTNYNMIQDQDYLYTLVEQSGSQSQAAVIGSMVEYIKPTDSDAILNRLRDPNIRIASMTVTEGGYFLCPRGSFNQDHPSIQADAETYGRAPPRTVFGLLANALAQRRDAGVEPFTIMSCDNMPHNGDVTKRAVVGLAQLCDEPLAEWIHDNVAFPNSVVDRITPATSSRERELVRESYGIADDVPVFSEAFMQWIVEDKFPTGRPAWDKVGVEFVDDVAPFERMKLKILNGGHATLGYAAALLGHHYVHDAVADPLIRAFLEKVERDDVLPIVGAVPGKDLDKYLDVVVERFGNPTVGDTTPRLCMDGSNRQPKFIVSSVRDNLAEGRTPDGLALVSALWCRYCYGELENGEAIVGGDENWEELVRLARLAKDNPRVWLDQKQVYGDVKDAPEFAASFEKWLNNVWTVGTRATLEEFTRGV